jgi:hypothetical protein
MGEWTRRKEAKATLAWNNWRTGHVQMWSDEFLAELRGSATATEAPAASTTSVEDEK